MQQPQTPAAGETAHATHEAHIAHAGHKGHGRGKWHFARHYLEMVVAMLVGMFVLGGAVRGVVALIGAEYTMERQPTLMTLEMALTMSIGMAAWMRYRGHGWAPTLEMCAAMFVPAFVLIPLTWAGALSADSLMMWEHVLMFPLMLLVMFRRPSEYGL